MRLGNRAQGQWILRYQSGQAFQQALSGQDFRACKGGGSIIKVDPLSGHLAPGESRDIILTLGSPDAVCGTYSLCLHVSRTIRSVRFGHPGDAHDQRSTRHRD